MKKMHLSIPQPCHEDWNEMTPNERGRFCQSCQKTVVDFTAMSDVEVLNFFKRNTKNTCGRLSVAQLNQTYQQHKYQFIFKWAKRGILAFSIFSFQQLNAQIQTENHVVQPLEKVNSHFEEEDKILIYGKVLDLWGAKFENVTVQLVDTDVTAKTDCNGRFVIEIPQEWSRAKSWEIAVNHLNYETVVEKVIKENRRSSYQCNVYLGNDIMEHHYSHHQYITGLLAYAGTPKKTNTLYQMLKKWVTKR